MKAKIKLRFSKESLGQAKIRDTAAIREFKKGKKRCRNLMRKNKNLVSQNIAFTKAKIVLNLRS